MMTSILTYKEEKDYLCKIDINKYDGLDGKPVPFKIIEPLKFKNKIIILYPGASPYAEKHPNMEMLGIALAQNGYKIFIPRIPPLKRLDITETNVEWFAHFYIWLLDVYNLDSEDIAIAGISYGGAIMLKAYLNFKEDVPNPKMIMTYGTYADAESTLRFLLTGRIAYNGKHYIITPNEWGLIVIFNNYLKNLELDWDSSGVQEVMVLEIQEKIDERDKIISTLPSSQKNIVHSVLSGKATEEVISLCQAMIQNETATLRNLSPKYWCHEIQQKVFIFHGANDSMIPFTESIQLAENIPDSELLLSYIYEHKEISTNKGTYFKLKEFIRMSHFFSKFYYYHEN